MAIMILEKKDDDLSVMLNGFTGSVDFFFNGERIATRSLKECEELYPQYLWWKLKQKENKYIKFIL